MLMGPNAVLPVFVTMTANELDVPASTFPKSMVVGATLSGPPSALPDPVGGAGGGAVGGAVGGSVGEAVGDAVGDAVGVPVAGDGV
jgi:hypothetical protein